MSRFASVLSAIRRQRGFTQLALGERSGIHSTQIARFERGLRPSIDAIGRLSRALDVPALTLAEAAIIDLDPAPAASEQAAVSPNQAGACRGARPPARGGHAPHARLRHQAPRADRTARTGCGRRPNRGALTWKR
jgi:transcriptional regulator with XRE-family HTH domain